MHDSSEKTAPARRRHGPAVALIVDQGGVRGMQPAVYMQKLEEMLGYPLGPAVDLVAFTSTGQIAGSIITAGDPERPGHPKFPASFGVDSYAGVAQETFPPRWQALLRQIFAESKHIATPLENHLNAAFCDIRVNESVTSVMYFVNDVETGETRCIRMIRDREDNMVEEYQSNMRISDVVRAGVTAPTILPVRAYPLDPDNPKTLRHAYMDAASSNGNVPHEVWHTLGRIAPGEERIILYLGTGKSPLLFMTPQKYNARGFAGFILGKEKRDHFLSMAFNSATNASIRFLKKEMGENFIHLNAAIEKNNPEHPTLAIDDGRPLNMERHRKLAEQCFLDNLSSMNRLRDILIDGLELPQAAPERSQTRFTQPQNDNKPLQNPKSAAPEPR